MYTDWEYDEIEMINHNEQSMRVTVQFFLVYVIFYFLHVTKFQFLRVFLYMSKFVSRIMIVITNHAIYDHYFKILKMKLSKHLFAPFYFVLFQLYFLIFVLHLVIQ